MMEVQSQTQTCEQQLKISVDNYWFPVLSNMLGTKNHSQHVFS